MTFTKRALLLVLSVVLYVAAFPTPALWPLIFVAMVPALIATRDLDPWPAAKWGFAQGFLVGALGITWFWNIFAQAAIPLWAIFAAWFGVFHAGRAILRKGFSPVACIWLTPVWWTAVEFFRAECYYLRCTFLCLGHALAAESCFLRMAASWFGAYGLGLLIMGVNVAIAALIMSNPRQRKHALAVASVSVLLLVATAGIVSVTAPGAGGEPIRVALVQSETPFIDDKIELSREADDDATAFILWPEISVLSDVTSNPMMRDPVAQLAKDTGAYVAVGSKLNHPTESDNFRNAYVLFGPSGKVSAVYDKIQTVQFMKDGVPGKEYGVFDTKHGKLGIAICYDGDFSWIPRNTVRRGAEVLVIPVYDGQHWGKRMRWQHLAAHVMRAMENGRYVLRPASSGPSVIIDPKGRITARRDAMSAGVVRGEFAMQQRRTVYTRFGWLLPYACQIASIILLIPIVLVDRRPTPADKPATGDTPVGAPDETNRPSLQDLA